MMPRERLPSSPFLESRDEPHAISPADFEAHLLSHAQLERDFTALRERARRSDSVSLQGPGGWTLKGRGWYIVLVAGMALLAFIAWLRLR